jgi:enoyl-CoA hydratase
VVPHGDLLAFTHLIAADIIGNERDGVRRMLQTYKEYSAETGAWENEAAVGAQWRRTQFATEKVAERRAKIMERGRQQ